MHLAKPLADRVMAKVEYDTAGGCWLWTAAISQNGYGRLGPASDITGSRQAHRVAYELFCEPIPEGLQLDHKCRVRSCVNPAHLEPVTREENMARGNAPHILNARKTHCKRGHEFTPENTIADDRGGRTCRTCARDRYVKRGHHQARKTHCPEGHAYEGDNLILWRGQRKCRECMNARRRVRP